MIVKSKDVSIRLSLIYNPAIYVLNNRGHVAYPYVLASSSVNQGGYTIQCLLSNKSSIKDNFKQCPVRDIQLYGADLVAAGRMTCRPVKRNHRMH